MEKVNHHGMGYDQKTTGMRYVCVYGPQTGRTEAEKQEFRDALDMMIGMVELETLLCIAGYFNAHIGETEPGEEENVGKCGGGGDKESRGPSSLCMFCISD